MKRTAILLGLIVVVLTGCNSQKPIAVLTDYGWDDPYVGAIQGVILTINPEARLLTITHSAPDYDIREASYILATAAKEFPKGTIFLAIVDPTVGSSRRPIIVETLNEKLFVGPDNGIFTDVIRSFGLKRAVEITNILWFRRGDVSTTFHGRDIFAPAAARLAAGKNIEDAGPAVTSPILLQRRPAELTDSGISGEILHRDHYGNLITNIPATILAKSGWRSGMTLDFVHSNQFVAARFAERYSAVAPGEFVLVLNAQGLLELARNMESAGDSLKASAGDSILVRTAGSIITSPSLEPQTTAAAAITGKKSMP